MEKAEFDKLVETAREAFRSAPSPIQVMWNGHDFISASEALKFVEEIEQLRARLAEAEKALRFYADEANHEWGGASSYKYGRVAADMGELAWKALQHPQGTEEGEASHEPYGLKADGL